MLKMTDHELSLEDSSIKFWDHEWTNEINAAYYEHIPTEIQRNFAEIGGLDTCCDLKQIEQFLFDAKSILEVGAGYGRILNYLINNKFGNKISAIERSSKFYNYLKNNFSNHAEIIYANLMKFQSNDKYDLILWMWSGISDFSKSEQLIALSRLSKHLSKNGLIIIDTFSHKLKPINASASNNQSYTVHVKNCTLYGYIPSPLEMEVYATKINLNSIKYIPYITPAERQRALYILSEKSIHS